MRARPLLCLALLLAACGSPQERCIQSATREMRTLDRLIAETEATLARGYGYETREVVRHVWTRCDDFIPGYGPHPYRRMCFEPVFHTVKEPVAIDPAAEARKLDGLKTRRAELAARAAPAIEACKVEHPE
ncbi:hypothetical protein R5H32_18535 [Defluviimonas sp. D31]|uniref:hypothetical protein n=1 Tax=Defluviimonas sp. D31 TaxID=3083253 RepID=UPI00296E3273|nr:hypothetical protein [Defluviimonas sp. D31]MDW4551359.1 hypothetical protein [Defluviimonas sp. D31]